MEGGGADACGVAGIWVGARGAGSGARSGDGAGVASGAAASGGSAFAAMSLLANLRKKLTPVCYRQVRVLP